MHLARKYDSAAPCLPIRDSGLGLEAIRRVFVAQNKLESQHPSEGDQPFKRQALRMGFDFGEAALADAHPGGRVRLRQTEGFAPATENLAGLVGGEWMHIDSSEIVIRAQYRHLR